jgi:hypothetical protein
MFDDMRALIRLLIVSKTDKPGPLEIISCMEELSDIDRIERANGFEIVMTWARSLTDTSWVFSPENDGKNVVGSIRQFASIGCLWSATFNSDKSSERALHAQLVLSVIEQMPLSAIHADPAAWLFRTDDSQAYEQGKKIWYHHISVMPNEARLLINAANYLRLSDEEESNDLKMRALETSTDPELWASILHPRNKCIPEPDWDSELVLREWCQELDRCYSAGDDTKYNDICLAICHLMLRTWGQKHADAVRKHLYQFKDQGVFPVRMAHMLNTCLGIVALVGKDESLAITCLYDSVHSGWSKCMKCFGPCLLLVNEVLHLGYRMEAVAFLDKCREKWKLGADRVEEWLDEIQRGEFPDFWSR